MKKYLMIIMIILSLLVTTGCPHPEDPSIPTGKGSSNGTDDNDKEPDDPEPQLPVYDLKVYDLSKEPLEKEDFLKVIFQRCPEQKYKQYYNESNGTTFDYYFQYVTLVLDTRDFQEKNPLLSNVEAAEAISNLGLSYRFNDVKEIYYGEEYNGERNDYTFQIINNNVIAGGWVFPNYKVDNEIAGSHIKKPDGGFKNAVDYPAGFNTKWYSNTNQQDGFNIGIDYKKNYSLGIGGFFPTATKNVNLNELILYDYNDELYYLNSLEEWAYYDVHDEVESIGLIGSENIEIQKVSIDYVMMKLPELPYGSWMTDYEEGKEAVGYPAILDQIDYSQFYKYNVIPGKF